MELEKWLKTATEEEKSILRTVNANRDLFHVIQKMGRLAPARLEELIASPKIMSGKEAHDQLIARIGQDLVISREKHGFDGKMTNITVEHSKIHETSPYVQIKCDAHVHRRNGDIAIDPGIHKSLWLNTLEKKTADDVICNFLREYAMTKQFHEAFANYLADPTTYIVFNQRDFVSQGLSTDTLCMIYFFEYLEESDSFSGPNAKIIRTMTNKFKTWKYRNYSRFGNDMVLQNADGSRTVLLRQKVSTYIRITDSAEIERAKLVLKLGK